MFQLPNRAHAKSVARKPFSNRQTHPGDGLRPADCQKHIERIGKLKNCVAYGPGILDLAHQPDEYISVDDMLDSAKVMAISLQGLLK